MRAPLSLLALLFAGCSASGPAADGRVPSGADLVGPTWRLVSVDGTAATSEATVEFSADGRVSGSTGCNTFSGTFTVEPPPDSDFVLSPLATTRRACAPDAMDQERRVLAALAAAEDVALDGDLLTISDDGETPLVYRRTAGASASATRATLTGAVTYRPRIALLPDAAVTVRLLDVSRADAPARTLAETTFEADGRQVPLAFSLGYDPAEIEPRARYTVRAEIRDGDGTLAWTTDAAYPVLTNGAPSDGVEVRVVQVEPRDSDTGALVGPTWRLRQLRTSDATPRVFDADAPYTLAFGAGGRYSGQADCNRIGGAFEAGPGGALVLDQGVSTLAACSPSSAAGDVLGVLNAVEWYETDGPRLVLHGPAGSLTLVRDSDDTGGMAPQETLRDYAYTCDDAGGPFTFRTRTGPGELAVWLPEQFADRDGGTYVVLGQVRAASGAKYQDGPVTVWTRGASEALLEVDGETFAGCRARA